jgi:hypothetical protein
MIVLQYWPYDRTVITIVNYDYKTFIVHANFIRLYLIVVQSKLDSHKQIIFAEKARAYLSRAPFGTRLKVLDPNLGINIKLEWK